MGILSDPLSRHLLILDIDEDLAFLRMFETFEQLVSLLYWVL